MAPFFRLKVRVNSWPVIAAAILLTQAVVSLTVQNSDGWLIIINFVLLFLLVLATSAAAVNAVRSTRAVRLFWFFLGGACGLWALAPVLWIYSIVIQRQKQFPIWATTCFLFIHVVFLIAAVASSPHLKSPSQKPYRVTLNFFLLLLFWVFAYAYMMYPYRHAADDVVVLRFEIFYLAENLLLVVALGMLVFRTEAPWKTIYWHVFGASALYAVGSLAGNLHYAWKGSSAGPVHIPYLASACWFVWVALQGRKLSPQLARTVRLDDRGTRYPWVLAMLAVVAVPLVGIWELLRTGDTEAREARLLMVLVFAVLLALVLFFRESRINRELSSDAVLANDQLRLAMESGKTVGWDWDVKSGRDVWFGDLQTMFGIEGDTYRGHVDDFRRRVHPEDQDLVWAAVQEAINDHKPYRPEFRLVWEDGTVRWVTASGKFYYAPNGEPVRMLGIAQDITERKWAEAALRESEERFRLVANTAPVMIWMAGPDKARNYFNHFWLEFTGRPIEAELESGWTASLRAEDLRQYLETYGQSFDRRRPFKVEYMLRRHDGEYRWVLDTGVPRFGPEGTFAGYIGSCIDVTNHKLAEEALSSLSRKLIEAHEEERSWIARELHDDVCQRMSLLTIQLERLGQVALNAAEMRSRVQELCRRVMDLGKDIQGISHRLHSSKLEHLGIAAAAGGFCKELAEQQKVDIEFHHDGVPEELPHEAALCLFRVLQEALRNAVKHAGVRHFNVELRGTRNDVFLEVMDGGIGFDPEAAMRSRGLGLISMQERLNLVKGEIFIESRPGEGTRVRARVPIRSGDRIAEAIG